MKFVPIVERGEGCRKLVLKASLGQQAVDGAHLATEARLSNSQISYHDLDSAQ